MENRQTKCWNVERQFRLLGVSGSINKLFFFAPRAEAQNHRHSYLEFHYNISGVLQFQLDFNRKTEIGMGEWILIGENIFHQEKPSDACEGYCFGIQLEKYNIEKLFPGIKDKYFYKGNSAERVGDILIQISKEYGKKEMCYKEYGYSLFQLLLIELVREIQGNTPPIVEKDFLVSENFYVIIDDFFNRVFNYEHEELTLDALAALLHMSRRNVSRILREYYGMTFQQLLLSTKLKLAEYLLLHSEESVSMISDQCGLTEAYLIRMFKEKIGFTPGQYRKLKSRDTF